MCSSNDIGCKTIGGDFMGFGNSAFAWNPMSVCLLQIGTVVIGGSCFTDVKVKAAILLSFMHSCLCHWFWVRLCKVLSSGLCIWCQIRSC